MAQTIYHDKTSLTGGSATALDGIDGNSLVDGDRAYVLIPGTLTFYVYRLNATSGAAESSPNIIAPDTNPGDKRWILFSVMASITGLQQIVPNGNFTLRQNSVNVLTSEETGGIANTLYLKAGNVGIGTTGPQYKVSVGAGGDAFGLYVSASSFSSWTPYAAADASQVWNMNNAAGGMYRWQWGGSDKMVLNSNGNVGIGTTNPVDALEIARGSGTEQTGLVVTNTNPGGYGSGISFRSRRSDTLADVTAAKIGVIGAASWASAGVVNSDLAFSVVNASVLGEAMRIKANGNIGIGTTAPNYQLELSTDSAGKPGAGGLWTVVSDERIKKDIELANLDRCYEIIKSIPLKRFGWADGVYTEDQVNDRHNLGWIAQDVKKAFSKAVSIKPFTKAEKIPDGQEEYEEQDFTIEEVEKEEVSIEIRDGKPVQIKKIVKTENKIVLFDSVEVVDEEGNVVLQASGEPLTHQVPRMIKKIRDKFRQEVIEDCLDLNSGQLIAALYGAVQHLMVMVEELNVAKNKGK